MTFFPGYFRLTQRSARTYRFFTDGGGGTPGPPGPQGPAGQGVVDYDDTEVDQGIEFIPAAANIFRIVVDITGGPSFGIVAFPHGITAFNDIIEIRGCINDGSVWIPLPRPGNTNSPFAPESISVDIDLTDVYLSSDGDFSAFRGYLIIDFLA